MSRGRGRGDFGDPFGNPFGGFGPFGGMFGNVGSLMSGLMGGRDPFDDPFFTSPFGGMFPSNFMGYNGSPFADMRPPAFPEHQALEPNPRRGPIIEEINSDDENNEEEKTVKKKKENPRIHGSSSNQPNAALNDEAEERMGTHLQYRNSHNRFNDMVQQPQTHSYTFQSSSVSYGGANGNYYTKSMTRRSGSDGVAFQEFKEADSSTRQATHRVSRGLHNKGHTLTRNLNSDGKVDTMQTLHNLHQDELAGFEEAWDGKAGKYLPGRSGGGHDNTGVGSSRQIAQGGRQGNLALPSGEGVQLPESRGADGRNMAGFSRMQQSGKRKGPSNMKDKSSYT